MERWQVLQSSGRWISGRIGLEVLMENNEIKVMRFENNEKYYKIYIFTPAGAKKSNFEYRVLTKELENGKLELVSYNHKMFAGESIKTELVQATDIVKTKLPEIILQLLEVTKTVEEDCREIDLSSFMSYPMQMQYLEDLEGLNEEFLV